MPTNRTKRTRKQAKTVLSDAWRYFLETGDYCVKDKSIVVSPYDKFHIFQCGNPGYWERKLKPVWMEHRAEILRDWKAKKKKGRPWAEPIFNEKKEGSK